MSLLHLTTAYDTKVHVVHSVRVVYSVYLESYTFCLKPCFLFPKPQTLNLKPQTPNRKPQTLNPKSFTLIPKRLYAQP